MGRSGALAVLFLGCLASRSQADDWPQWLGPRRDSIWREDGILRRFPEQGLNAQWRAPVGGGYSGPAVAEGRVYVTDYVPEAGDATNDPNGRSMAQGRERVLCFDAREGRRLWKHEYECPYDISYAAGPRATPTVHDGKVYALGAMGNLCCLDAREGNVLWAKDLKQEYEVKVPMWGFCGHPLVDGDKLICIVGGEGSVAVALDRNSGKELWRALSASEPGYSAPTMIEAAGRRQLVIWHADAINALDPETGELYWSVPLKPDFGMSIMTPRQHGDFVFASGIGNVAALLRLDPDRPAAEVVWRGRNDTAVYCANSTPFIEDGTIYGTDCRNGQLRGVDLETGKRLWETWKPTTGERRAGHGTAFIVKHEDRYFLLSETGDLILAKFTTDGYEEISRFHLLEPTGEAFGRNVLWSHPAFADKCVYARNDRELICVSLAR